jgi:hypothetical protein
MSRRIAVASAVIGVALLALYLVVWLRMTPVQERGSDFSVSWVAAQLVREGHGAQLYDQALEHARHAAILPGDVTFNLPFLAPPATALLALPSTLLDAGDAYRVWSLLQAVMLGAALAIAARAAPWPVRAGRGVRAATVALAAASPATLVLLLMGQWDGVIALGLAAAYVCWRTGRSAGAGFALALALGTTKPHLGLGLAAFLLARRDGRALLGASAGIAVAAGLSLAAAGAAGFSGFAGAINGAFSNTPPQSTLGLAGLVSSWLGSGPATAVLVALGSLVAVVAAMILGSLSRRPERLEWAFGGAIALSLLLAPHLLAHDLVLLAVPMVFCTASALTRGSSATWPLVAIVALGVMIGADAGNSAFAPPGRLVPLGLIAGAAIALIVLRPSRSPRTTAQASASASAA